MISPFPLNGNGVTVAQRNVPLQGAINFRDLGGYATNDGRRVRWGRLFRSGHLSNLTKKDKFGIVLGYGSFKA